MKEYIVKDSESVEEIETVVTTRIKGRIHNLPSLIAQRDALDVMISELTLVILEKEDLVK